MASLISSVFASTYGKNRPKFFWWYEPGTSASEKKLLFKIDFFILTFGCLSYFTKWLDQGTCSSLVVFTVQFVFAVPSFVSHRMCG